MGREATCECKWGEEGGTVKIHLDHPDLMVRGAISRNIFLSELSDIKVVGQALVLKHNSTPVAFDLGEKDAAKWLIALTTPPPTLAEKLGIKPSTRIKTLGNTSETRLTDAIGIGNVIDSGEADLMILSVESRDDLGSQLNQILAPGNNPPPIWIVYPKGKGHPIGEAIVREMLRNSGFVDVKVASVSSELTALRFVKK